MTITPLQRHLRVASALARMWFDPRNRPNHHGLRRARVSAAWPELGTALDALVETHPTADMIDAVGIAPQSVKARCPHCDSPVDGLTVNPDPRTAQTVHRLDPCAHTVDRATALGMYEAGVPVKSMTPVDGAALIRAEVARVRERGTHTPESDAEQDAGELAWAAWCLLDRMNHPDSDEVPAMWPYEPERWKPGQTPLRSLVVAGGFIAAEIDRRLQAGERLDSDSDG